MGVQRQLDTRDLLVAGVQAGVPGYSVNLLLFTSWYFSSGHLWFSGRWCPNLNLAKISLSLSRLKTTHDLRRGARDAPFLSGSKFFQFHAVFGKIWQNHMLTPPPRRVGVPTSGKSWIRHLVVWGHKKYLSFLHLQEQGSVACFPLSYRDPLLGHLFLTMDRVLKCFSNIN